MVIRSDDVFNDMMHYPITQDASASAYQIMSYFLLDRTLAERTNLCKSINSNDIQCLYENMLIEVQQFIKTNYSTDALILNVGNILNRKIVKGIFMPLIYGKTIMSTAQYLQEVLPLDLGKRDTAVAKVFYVFFEKQYSRLYCLMNLIQNIGWLSSERDLPVYYSVPLFTTIQDYIKHTDINIWVYTLPERKRRRMTLSIPSDKRDSRKTKTSTFVNFIHQKDAFLAMSVVYNAIDKIDNLKERTHPDFPIYTVHDNFISTPLYCHNLPSMYSSAYKIMGPPLHVINEFIYMNIENPSNKINESCINRVIPSHVLDSLLTNCIPINFRNKSSTWTKKKKLIIQAYNNYINAVCGTTTEVNEHYSMDQNEARHEVHLQKWKRFKDNLSDQYCVHY